MLINPARKINESLEQNRHNNLLVQDFDEVTPSSKSAKISSGKAKKGGKKTGKEVIKKADFVPGFKPDKMLKDVKKSNARFE